MAGPTGTSSECDYPMFLSFVLSIKVLYSILTCLASKFKHKFLAEAPRGYHVVRHILPCQVRLTSDDSLIHAFPSGQKRLSLKYPWELEGHARAHREGVSHINRCWLINHESESRVKLSYATNSVSLTGKKRYDNLTCTTAHGACFMMHHDAG